MNQDNRSPHVDPDAPRDLSPAFEKLVDREEQLVKFKDVLDRISRQGLVSSNLFEWYGSPGIGKSMLVKMLTHLADEKHAAWAVIDFKQPEENLKGYHLDPILLIEETVFGLQRRGNLDMNEFDKALHAYRIALLPDEGVVTAYSTMDQETRLYRRPEWLIALRNVIIAFIKLINTIPPLEKENGIRPVVLFFDETEQADIDLLDWIEEWIVNPLIQVRHCVVVWTARRPWRWKRPEIRRRLTSELLTVFEPEMVKEQIQFGSTKPDLVSELFKNVYTLTGGHPFANYIVINELDSLASQGKSIAPENFQDLESKLLEEIFDRFVDQYAFNELKSNDLKIACKYISLVRLFDATMLRKILQACVGDFFKSWQQDDFGNLLLNLKKTQLLVWEKGYAIDSGVRHIVQKYFKTLDRSAFATANYAALQVYADWLGRPVDNRSLFVLEELYHCAALRQIGEEIDISAKLMKRLREYPKWIKDDQALKNALERLEGEINNDKELEQLVPSSVALVKLVQVFREEHLAVMYGKK